MHVGLSIFLQSLGGDATDGDVYRHGMDFVDLVEPLGFQEGAC